jgi:hypothetical protein
VFCVAQNSFGLDLHLTPAPHQHHTSTTRPQHSPPEGEYRITCVWSSILHTSHETFALGRCILRPCLNIFRVTLASVYMVIARVRTPWGTLDHSVLVCIPHADGTHCVLPCIVHRTRPWCVCAPVRLRAWCECAPRVRLRAWCVCARATTIVPTHLPLAVW